MSQLFISYSRVDNAFVEGLISRIETAFPDLDIWHDRSPHGLIGGDRWWDEILKAVAESDVFVYVLSNESVQSLYCQAEFTEARRLQKRIITIQARDRTELTEELADIQFVDMHDGPDDPDALPRLFAAIDKQLKRARNMRPLWKPATPKPRKEAPPTRSADAPTVETPPLKRPSAEDEALVIARRTLRWQIIGTALGFAAIIVTIVLALPSLLNTPAPTEAAQIDNTPTSTNAPPQTDPPDPLQMAMQTQTREAELTRAAQPTATHTPTTDFQATIDAIATATRAYFQTADAVQTQQTFEAQATLDAANMATLQAWETIDAQATADAAATLTAQPTLDPLDAAYAQADAYDYRAGNAAWTPITYDFDGVTMVLVPPGCFMMGSERGNSDEMPTHEQCFNAPFWIDRTEVTLLDFERLGGVKAMANAYSGDGRPVENITWFEARDFCTQRGMRLPTEAEWEYAARGPEGWEYPWGNQWNVSNVVGNRSDAQGSAVAGSRPGGASWVGALDMSGNVWEWVSSLYLPYDSQEGREAETGTPADARRVLRGGAWNEDSADVLRAAYRGGSIPDYEFHSYGFRCILLTVEAAATLTAQPSSTPVPPTSDPLQAAYAQADAYDYRAGNAAWTPIERDFDGVTMVLVPPGSFEMGSTATQIDAGLAMCQQAADNNATCERSWFEDELIPAGGNTQAMVTFWIDRTEVTRAQYQDCVDAGVCEETPSSDYSTERDQPINRVTWLQAKTYCETWRDARLPTEAEWEYAARGPDGLIFPWGNDFDGTRANHCDSRCGDAPWSSDYNYINEENDDGYAVTAPVGNYLMGASWVGALDLSGNVWEWVSTLYKPYPFISADGREDEINSTDVRVVRGGSFNHSSFILRAAYRYDGGPDDVFFFIGFRCARSL